MIENKSIRNATKMLLFSYKVRIVSMTLCVDLCKFNSPIMGSSAPIFTDMIGRINPGIKRPREITVIIAPITFLLFTLNYYMSRIQKRD